VTTVAAYFKVRELAVDANDEPCYAGMRIAVSVSDNYDGSTNIAPLVDVAMLAGIFGKKPEDVIPIDAIEYERDFDDLPF
jgi:hypothetical protein